MNIYYATQPKLQILFIALNKKLLYTVCMKRDLLKEIIISQEDRRALRDHYIDRVQTPEIIKSFLTPHATVVMGVRRCGKSSLLNHLLQEHFPEQFFYLNFEDERLLKFDVADFNLLHEVFIELFGDRKIFYFDEIQNVDQWEIYIRRMQDSGYKFFLTGSNAALLSSEMGTKLTGRHLDIELFPFSFPEYLRFHHAEKTQYDFYQVKERGHLQKLYNQYLRQGGMPEYLQFPTQPNLLAQIYEDILFRDIVNRYEIKDVRALRELGLYLITNMARPFSYNKLKNCLDLGSVNTVKNYVEYLEKSYLLFTINQFSHSLNIQMTAPKKVYIIDNGMADHIAFQFSKNQGQFLENLVFTHLRRKHKAIFYYKTANNLEVDFAIMKGRGIDQLIQVSADLSHEKTKKRELDALLRAMEETGLNNALLVTDHLQEELKIAGKTITVIPAYQWLLQQ